jgi:hypothetical protein
MMASFKGVFVAAVLGASIAVSSLGQVPSRTIVHFTISVPTAVTIGNYVLAPGTYVLYQDSQARELFALYPGSLAKEPIAQILTTRTPYWAVRNNRQTRIELKMVESRSGLMPVVKGFNVPWADRWDIVSVVAKRDSGYMTRIK